MLWKHSSPSTGDCQGGTEELQAHQGMHKVSLWWTLQSLSQDQLPHLSAECRRSRVDMGHLSEMRRPSIEEISSGGFTHYWSCQTICAHLGGIAAAIFNLLHSSVTTIPVDDHKMLVRKRHSMLSLTLLNQHSRYDTLIVLSDSMQL